MVLFPRPAKSLLYTFIAVTAFSIPSIGRIRSSDPTASTTASGAISLMSSGVTSQFNLTSIGRFSTSRISRFLKFLISTLWSVWSVKLIRPPNTPDFSHRITWWPLSDAVIAVCRPPQPPPTTNTFRLASGFGMRSGRTLWWDAGHTSYGLMVQESSGGNFTVQISVSCSPDGPG